MLPEKLCGFGNYSLIYLTLIVINYDNQSCVKLSENPMFHDRSKHIEIKYHYVRDMVQRRAVSLRYIPIDEQTADVLTKPLSKTKFEYFREKLGLVENAPLARGSVEV